MRKLHLILAACLMTALGVQAQRLEVVDTDGNSIHLVSVLTEEGNMIGTTSLEGVIADLKGEKRVVLTHVAYKSKLVDVSSLQNGKVTMEDLDYNLAEIVIMPKPYIYVETYYRVYAFANDSLRYYLAGIMPNAYDKEKKKVKSGSYLESHGEFSLTNGIAITWGARAQEFKAGKIHKSGAGDFLKGGKSIEYYFVTLTDEGKGRKRVSNPEGTVGFIETEENEVHMTLDAGKMQMYRNKALGQERLLKAREEREYDYEFNEVFNLDETGNSSVADLVMSSDHWEWNGNKGRMKFIIETYATEHAYIDSKEFKAKKNELKKTYKSSMTLEQLENFATTHGIPALTPSLRRAIEKLPKKPK
ncbi:MAG: hypothetical protein J6V92_06715 [Bacteroidaceae bacterium]|nr:hypothetical protein [Bacteroidaceae bacterium]